MALVRNTESMPNSFALFLLVGKQQLMLMTCQSMEMDMIRHTVVFRLKHPKGSDAEAAFLKVADVLAGIPEVQKFEKLRQVSPKNDYAFGFSFEFADQAAYDHYNNHADHVAFVRDRWIPEVAAFMEIDYVALQP